MADDRDRSGADRRSTVNPWNRRRDRRGLPEFREAWEASDRYTRNALRSDAGGAIDRRASTDDIFEHVINGVRVSHLRH